MGLGLGSWGNNLRELGEDFLFDDGFSVYRDSNAEKLDPSTGTLATA